MTKPINRAFARDWVGSSLVIYVLDLDFASVYPSVMVGANISRDTFKLAIYAMEGYEPFHIQIVASRSINVRENAVPLMSEYFGLPKYSEMNNLLELELKEL